MARRSEMTVHAWVATTPSVRTLPSGQDVTEFRIADSVRRRDAESGEWRDSKTTWYTVRVWGDQGLNVVDSLQRSDAVVVTGHPWVHEWTRDDGSTGYRLYIDADSVSPDLARGQARFVRRTEGSRDGDSERVKAARELGQAAVTVRKDTDGFTAVDTSEPDEFGSGTGGDPAASDDGSGDGGGSASGDLADELAATA